MNKDWQNEFFDRLLELAKGNVPKGNWTEEWKDLMEFKRKHLPSSLLRFRPIQNENELELRKSEIEGVLYFSDVRKLNDPFDSSLLLMNSDNLFYNNLVKGRIEDVVNSGYIACFNELPIDSLDTLPMWAHYARDHKGCCMKYDDISLWPPEWQDALFPVNYRDNFQDFLNEFKRDEDSWEYEYNALYKYIMSNKFDCWRYENEWRIILDKNLLKKFSKIPDMNICIHPTNMLTEHGVSLFRYNNYRIKEKLFEIEKILNCTYKEVYDEPIVKIQKKSQQEIDFEQLLTDNEDGDLGIINHTFNDEPEFRGISLRFLEASQIIFGKSNDATYKNNKNKLIAYCRNNTIEVLRNMGILDVIFDENRIKFREIKDMSPKECENGIINILKGESYQEGVKKTLINLVKEQLLSISDAAKKLNVSEIEFKHLMEQQ